MANSDIEKVWTVLQGIGSASADLATRHINPKSYIEHNPRIADGVDGLRQYLSQFSQEDHHLNVVRAFQDGPYVFSQEDGLILGQGVFFDVFRFEDGPVVEHWGFQHREILPIRVGILKPADQLRRKLQRIQRRTSRSSGATTRPFTSLEITVKFRSIFLEIVASVTSPASGMESRHSSVIWKTRSTQKHR